MERLVAVVAKVPQTIRYDDDAIDRLSHRYTTMVLVVFALLTTMQQYVGRPITCWVPKEFTGSHTKYTNSYCWVKNTYVLPLEHEIPKEHETHLKEEIVYYQWMPFIFLLMAFFFYIPCQVWRTFNSKAGVDADNILDAAENFQRTDKAGKRDQTLRLIVNQMDRFLGHRQSSGLGGTCSNMLATVCCFCGKRLGNYLTILYFFVKVLYVGNVFAQLFVLNSVLKTSFNLYGVEAIENVINEQAWINETVFPKVTMCDLHVRRLGNVQRYTVQCLLPVNLYTEKMFFFLWFWMVAVLFVSVLSFATWFLRAVCNDDRHRYVRNHLALTDRQENETDKALSLDFVTDYLKQDGVFILRLISHNTNNITVNEIIAGLWDAWLLSRPGGLGTPQNGARPKLTEPLTKPDDVKLRRFGTPPREGEGLGEAPPIYTPTTEKDV